MAPSTVSAGHRQPQRATVIAGPWPSKAQQRTSAEPTTLPSVTHLADHRERLARVAELRRRIERTLGFLDGWAQSRLEAEACLRVATAPSAALFRAEQQRLADRAAQHEREGLTKLAALKAELDQLQGAAQ